MNNTNVSAFTLYLDKGVENLEPTWTGENLYVNGYFVSKPVDQKRKAQKSKSSKGEGCVS